jgi:hypothetical protein
MSKDRFPMYRLGSRDVYLNPMAIAYFTSSDDHDGVVIVLTNGERIDGPNWKINDFAKELFKHYSDRD